MKIGDLVAGHGIGADTPYSRDQRGIIVDGPHKGTSGDQPAVSYTVAWFDPERGSILRHLDFNLEVLSESR